MWSGAKQFMTFYVSVCRVQVQSFERGSGAASEQPRGSRSCRSGALTMTVPENPDVLEGKLRLRQAARRQTYQTQRLWWTALCLGGLTEGGEVWWRTLRPGLRNLLDLIFDSGLLQWKWKRKIFVLHADQWWYFLLKSGLALETQLCD